MTRLSRRAAWWLLAWVLVVAQVSGLMHRIVHGPQAVAGPDRAHAHSHTDASDHHGAGWVAELFSGHDDDSSCRLFDPLNHDALPAVPVLVLPLALTPALVLQQQREFVARWTALFDARGPPSLR
jgi:hypothetical protein